MKTNLKLFAVIAAASLAAGCSRHSDEAQVEANTTQSEVSVPIPAEQAAPAIPATSNLAAANAVSPEPALSQEAQMMEDAEATGMTSRMAAGTGQEEAPANAQDTSGQ
jgi:hypothetical protein